MHMPPHTHLQVERPHLLGPQIVLHQGVGAEGGQRAVRPDALIVHGGHGAVEQHTGVAAAQVDAKGRVLGPGQVWGPCAGGQWSGCRTLSASGVLCTVCFCTHTDLNCALVPFPSRPDRSRLLQSLTMQQAIVRQPMRHAH